MGKATVTLRYRAQTTAAEYRQLKQVLLDMGLLYNAHRRPVQRRHLDPPSPLWPQADRPTLGRA